jgi:hypothetical protein
MNNMTCLQYVINGMGEKLLSFAKTKEGRTLITAFKNFMFTREEQIRELIIAHNSYFMVQAGVQIQALPKTQKLVISFMGSDIFEMLHDEIAGVVTENYPLLISYMTRKQRRTLNALFS